MRALFSTSSDVYENLAAEELFLDDFERSGPLLFFYVDSAAIVVGKNQNPWRECATGWARRRGVPIARRLSGGGTVWHDPGNLNFSLILSRADYRQDEVFARVLQALASLMPLQLERAGNSLMVAGRKFSGAAFCFRGPAVLHHATLLIDAKLELLRRAMEPALPMIETRAVPSRPAPTVNLREFVPSLGVSEAARALASVLAPDCVLESWSPPPDDRYRNLVLRHRDPAWIFGYTPAFTVPLPDGYRVEVENGLLARLCRPDGAVTSLDGLPFEQKTFTREVLPLLDGRGALLAELDW